MAAGNQDNADLFWINQTSSCNLTSHKIMNFYYDKDLEIRGIIMVYKKFDSLRNFHFECDSLLVQQKFDLKPELFKLDIYFFFDSFPIINETIDMSDFKTTASIIGIVFAHLDGFQIDMPSSVLRLNENLNANKGIIILSLRTTKFDFYYKNQLVGADLCDAEVFEKIDISIFTNLQFVIISFADVIFINPICSLHLQEYFGERAAI